MNICLAMSSIMKKEKKENRTLNLCVCVCLLHIIEINGCEICFKEPRTMNRVLSFGFVKNKKNVIEFSPWRKVKTFGN